MLVVTDTPTQSFRDIVMTQLREYNLGFTGPNDYQTLAVELKDSEDKPIGGLIGGTSYGWLCIQVVVVPTHLRRQGLGAKIMRRAEQEALERKCHGTWLDTFEFQARSFYESIGYECFGALDDYPGKYSRYFMRKELK